MHLKVLMHELANIHSAFKGYIRICKKKYRKVPHYYFWPANLLIQLWSQTHDL